MHAMKAVKKELDSMSKDEKDDMWYLHGIRMVYDDDEGCGYGDPPPQQQDKKKKDKKGKGKHDKMPKPSCAPVSDQTDFDGWFEGVGTQC